MKVLLTGAFGNVGSSTLEELISRNGFEITCFDLKNFETWRTARKFRGQMDIIWGDIRDKNKLRTAVANQDIVVHMAAIIPPRARFEPEYTEEVNVGGTRNLIEVMNEQPHPPKLLYTSSVAIYGDVRNKKPPTITLKDPVNPSPGDNYGETKATCEELIKNSGLDWSIFRLSYIPNSKKIKLDPLMFDMPLDTLLEFTHTKDCGLAIANAITKEEIWGRMFNIGGGKDCQLMYKDFLHQMLKVMGVGPLPDEAFGTNPFHCGYYDTEESQALFNYQRHTFEHLLEEMKNQAPVKVFLARTFQPFVRWYILSKSKYYRSKNDNHSE